MLSGGFRPALPWVLGALIAAPGQAGAQQALELPDRDRMLEGAMEEVFSVGTFDGADWETFGEIRQVAFDGDGNLHILDAQTSRFVVVDREGGFLRMWGQAGEGPGEWRQAAGAAVFRDGSTAIADMGHGRFQVFDETGEFVGTAPLGDGGVVRVGRIQPDPRGDALFNGGGSTMMSMNYDGSGPPPGLPDFRPVERVVLGDSPRKEVFYRAWQAPRGEPSQMNAGGVQVMMMAGPRHFEPGLHVAVLPQGQVAVVDSSAYSVKILDESGTPVRRVTRDIEPMEVTDRIQRSEIQRQIDELESGDGPRMRIVTDDGSGAREMPRDQVNRMMRQRIESQGFFPEIPVVRRLAAGWDGLLWLERSRVSPDDPGPVDLFTADGTYRGTIAEDGPRIPDAFGPGGLVAYIERDEMDVPVVVVRRLPAELR